MIRVIIASLYLTLSLPTFAFFSSHVIITPKNVSEHKEYKIWLYCDKDDPEMVNIILPFHAGMKKYWLISSNRELTDKELIFRDLIWRSYKPPPRYITQVVPISPPRDDEDKAVKGAFIKLKLKKTILSKSYIYHDFDTPVDDGGYYRTYRLTTFPIGKEWDYIRNLEMDVSYYKRLKDNSKHREAESKLKDALADKVFMAAYRKKHKAEQDGADQPATAPESKSEGNDKPKPESEVRPQ